MTIEGQVQQLGQGRKSKEAGNIKQNVTHEGKAFKIKQERPN